MASTRSEQRLALSRPEPAAERLDSMTTIAAEQPTQLQTQPVAPVLLRRILGTWAAAALPMATLAWVIAPWLAGVFEGPSALFRALTLCLTAGLVWQFVLVMVLVREQGPELAGDQERAVVARSAQSTYRAARRPALAAADSARVALAAEEFLPTLPTPAVRDLALFLGSAAGQSFRPGIGSGWQ